MEELLSELRNTIRHAAHENKLTATQVLIVLAMLASSWSDAAYDDATASK